MVNFFFSSFTYPQVLEEIKHYIDQTSKPLKYHCIICTVSNALKSTLFTSSSVMSPCFSLILLAIDFDNSTISLACQENSKRMTRNNVPKMSENKIYFQNFIIIGMNLINVNDIYLDH